MAGGGIVEGDGLGIGRRDLSARPDRDAGDLQRRQHLAQDHAAAQQLHAQAALLRLAAGLEFVQALQDALLGAFAGIGLALSKWLVELMGGAIGRSGRAAGASAAGTGLSSGRAGAGGSSARRERL